MNTLRAGDGDASERELLVDDIKRIREVLHISAGADKLSSDEEGDEGSEEDEEQDDEPEKCGQSLIGSTSNDVQLQKVTYLSPLGSNIAIPGRACRDEDIEEQSLLNTRKETVSTPVSNHAQGFLNVSPLQQQADGNLLPPQSTDEYTFTELQPVNYQLSTSALSTSDPFTSVSSATVNSFTDVPYANGLSITAASTSNAGYSDATWLVGTDHLHGQSYTNEQEEEDDEELFLEGNDRNDAYGDLEVHSEIQQCLSLNRDYQLAVLDELERIELALAKNREKQLGLHQMRASKDEGRPEPHTLIKFANPYFKDSGAVGPPDNDDTKIKRQSCQVECYQAKPKLWNLKEKEQLAEGVRMQNLENKLSPILQKIQKLELKKDKTETELQELEHLKAENSRIKNLPKEKLAHDLEGIDWDRISCTYVPKRSGLQCRLHWCNFGHPDVNRSPWTKEEDKKLIQLAKDPQNTWVTIAQNLQTKRTPIHCYERYQRSLNKNLLKSKWTPEDDQQLLEVVRVVGLGNWPRVASFLEGRQGDQCLHRYTHTLQMVRKGKWTKDEDELLKNGIEKYGTAWHKLSEVVPGRSGPQCRERWVNALDPTLDKGPWTHQQDMKLLENVEKFGKGNWSKIARAMGKRTDNQCWRRWIVLCKDDFLYYRQNTLRKKRELVSNFTGRKQERPALAPEDLDIPDVPVVKKRKPGRVPLPPEVSRERRRLTRAKCREKKRAEKRRAEEEARQNTLQQTRHMQHAEGNEGTEEVEKEGEEMEGMEDNDQEATAAKKSPRNRKAGRNRTRVQQPHHRVLMKNKQLFKTKTVAQQRQKRQTETAGEEKTVAVSGSLGPFSLLLQAFSIDIPTVLQAIQQTASSTTPAPSGTSVSPVAGNPAVENNTPGDQRVVQTTGDAGNQADSQQAQTGASDGFATSQYSANTAAGVRNVASNSQAKPVRKNEERMQTSSETDSRLLTEKRSGIGGDQADESRVMEPAVGLQNASEENNSETTNTGRVEAGNTSTASTPTTVSASTTSQAPRRRAPAIPPLPPCFTTLRTFKSLLLLRPQLQKIAAMLNQPAGSQAYQPSTAAACPAVPTGSHSNTVSLVTCEAREGSYDVHTEASGNTKRVTERNENVLLGKGSEPVNKSRDNEITTGEDHVVSPECARDIQPRKALETGKEYSFSAESVVMDDRSLGGAQLATEGLQIAVLGQEKALETASSDKGSCAQYGGAHMNEDIQMRVNNIAVSRQGNADTPTLSSDSSARGGGISHGNDKQTTTTSNEGTEVSSPSIHVSTAVEKNSQGTPAVTGARLYRNSYEYKLLSSRFNSLFLWPALLSKIPVRFTSQIGPVFAERHPPPIGGFKSRSKAAEILKPRERNSARRPLEAATAPFKRKHPGLAAVRMASCTSFTTPAQQMFSVGQGSAIRKETAPGSRPGEGSREVALAASLLVSLREGTQSLPTSTATTAAKRPYNTRKSKRKAMPVKRRKRFLESSSDDDDELFVSDSSGSLSEDDSLVIDLEATQPVRNTRQASLRKPRMVLRTRGAKSTPGSRAASATAVDKSTPSVRAASATDKSTSSVRATSAADRLTPSVRATLAADKSTPGIRATSVTAADKSTPSVRVTSVTDKSTPTAADDTIQVASPPRFQGTGRRETLGTRLAASSPVVEISSDSACESQPPLRGVQEDTAGQQSGAAANQSPRPKSSSKSNQSPLSSSKRKNSRPEKNRGARWRAMLPKVPSDDSDA